MRQSVLIAGVIAAILAVEGNIFSANPMIAQQMLASPQSMSNTIPIFLPTEIYTIQHFLDKQLHIAE